MGWLDKILRRDKETAAEPTDSVSTHMESARQEVTGESEAGAETAGERAQAHERSDEERR